MSKNKWDRQDRQAGQLAGAASAQAAHEARVEQTQGGADLASTKQVAVPAQLAASAPATAPPPMEAIVLFNPTIELGAHLFAGTPAVQTNRLSPQLAYIVHGAIVIEELNLILPLAGNFVRTK